MRALALWLACSWEAEPGQRKCAEREHAFWRLLHDSGAGAAQVLALDVDHLDLARHRTRFRPGDWPGAGIAWQEATSQVLQWLVAGRTSGPVFVTWRRARATCAAAERCPLTGQARMSYRRAAELFTTLTRPLDPAGHGWTLHQLSAARIENPACTVTTG